MAEERNVATARAAEISDDEETTKADLQRRMEEARESISQTVTEIKDTVATQYQSVRESINDALDWREQFRKRPVAFSVGALSVGFFVGYGIASALSDNEKESDYNVFDVNDEDHDAEDKHYSNYAARSYAGGAITGQTTPSRRTAKQTTVPYEAHEETEVSDDEPTKPGLIERFKETRAFDRLQGEVSTLGDRFIDELSHTAQAVVLPALLGKLKDMVGLDLSTQQREARRSSLEKQATDAHTDAVKANDETANKVS